MGQDVAVASLTFIVPPDRRLIVFCNTSASTVSDVPPALAAMTTQNSGPHWFVPGDVDGLLALGLDNLIQILLILSLCGGVLGYPPGCCSARSCPRWG